MTATTAVTTAAAADGATPAQSVGYLLWHACRLWRRELSAALAPLNLTYAEWGLLGSLHWLAPPDPARAPGAGPTQREVADHAGIDAMVASEALRSLERRGLVRREASPRDRRARALALTTEGARLALAGVALVREVDRQVFARVGDPAAFATELAAIIAGGDLDP